MQSTLAKLASSPVVLSPEPITDHTYHEGVIRFFGFSKRFGLSLFIPESGRSNVREEMQCVEYTRNEILRIGFRRDRFCLNALHDYFMLLPTSRFKEESNFWWGAIISLNNGHQPLELLDQFLNQASAAEAVAACLLSTHLCYPFLACTMSPDFKRCTYEVFEESSLPKGWSRRRKYGRIYSRLT